MPATSLRGSPRLSVDSLCLEPHCGGPLSMTEAGFAKRRWSTTFDFSTINWILIALMALQPLLTGRWYAVKRVQAIRAIERKRGSRIIKRSSRL